MLQLAWETENDPDRVRNAPTRRRSAGRTRPAPPATTSESTSMKILSTTRSSERLESILDELEEYWDELVEALNNLSDEIRAGRTEGTYVLDPKLQAPFLGVLRPVSYTHLTLPT